MVAWCVVPSCKGAKSSATGVVSYHHFPTNDADRCREWLRRINHPKYDEHTPLSKLKNLRVCGLHFREEDFCKSMMAKIMGTAEKRRLQTDANPSIFSSTGKYELTSEVPGPPEERSWTDEIQNATAPASETVLTASTSATAFLLETVSEPEVVTSGDTHSCNNEPESPAAAITEVIGFTDESDFSDEENSTGSEYNSDVDWVPPKDHITEKEITDSNSGTDEINEDDDGTAVGLKRRQLCPECGKFFKNKTHTCEYKFKHYSCNVCGKRFVTEHHLKSHSKIHKDGYKHNCMFCLKTFKTRPDKLAHERSHPRVKKPYECPDCLEVFAQKRERNKHLLAHRGPKRYICHTCNMEFPHNTALERHVVVHTGAKQFVCEVCQRSFSQASHLKSHMRVHTGEKPYQCQYCDKSFNHNVSLKSHIQRYHGQVPDPGMKVQMKKPRRNESEAAEPDETNEMENNATLFTCHICNIEFPYSGVLERHVVVQTGKKQFVCEMCQRSFKRDEEEEKKDEEKKGRTKKGHQFSTFRPKGRPTRKAVITSYVTHKLKRKSCDGDSDSEDEEEEMRGSKRMKKTTRRSKGRAQIYGGEEQSSDSAGGRTPKNMGLKTVMTDADEGSCC